ncbi:MAG: phosphonate ABC transporter, permease protein PhnE [Candidatus Bipolaricaulaceae bacterium]
MAGYPEGFLSQRPTWSTWPGLLDALARRLRGLWQALAPTLLDLAALGTLWILASYLYGWLRYGEILYGLVPWWVFGVAVVELAALWESFGVSLAHRLSGRRLVQAGGGRPTARQRVIHGLTWHLAVLPLVGLLWSPPWHERLSGLRLRPAVGEGRAPTPWWRTSSGLFIAALLVVAVAAAVAVTVAPENLARLFSEAWRTAKFWRAFFNPDTTILVRSVQDLVVTVFMAVMATAFAVLVAVPLSFLAARNLMGGPLGRLVYTVLRGAMSIMRSIEPIVWAIIFLVWVTARRAPFAGVLALWVHSIADLTKLYAERLESIDPGLVEAVTATGAGRLSVLRYAVVPQIVNPYISFTLYRWDINIRMATVVGVVGGGGIGQRLYFYLKGNLWPQAGTVMLLIVILVWAIDYLSSRLRAKLA